MVGCAAAKCRNRSSRRSAKQLELQKNKPITFHRFPNDPEKKRLWVKAVHRSRWEPTPSCRLCSEHFEEKCFYRFPGSNVRLREDATPTIFPELPSYYQKFPKPRRPPLNRTLPNPKPTTSAEASTIVAKPLCSSSPKKMNGTTSSSSPQQHRPDSDLVEILRRKLKEQVVKYHKQILPNPKPTTSAAASTIVAEPSCSSSPEKFNGTTSSFSPQQHKPESEVVLILRRQLKEQAVKYRKQIRVLQQANRRYVVQIANLKNVMTVLRKANLLPDVVIVE